MTSPAVSWKPTNSGLAAYLADGRRVHLDPDSELGARALAEQWPLNDMIEAINKAYDIKPHLLEPASECVFTPEMVWDPNWLHPDGFRSIRWRFWLEMNEDHTFGAHAQKTPLWPIIGFIWMRAGLFLVVVAAMAYMATLNGVPYTGPITDLTLTEPNSFNVMQNFLAGMHELARTMLGTIGIPVNNAIAVAAAGTGSFIVGTASFPLEHALERSRSRIDDEHWARIAAAVARWRTNEEPRPAQTDRGIEKSASSTDYAAEPSHARRITEVHAAVARLDDEWLAYTLDTHAYFLAKPLLRDQTVPQTAAYRAALYELRELANQLRDTSPQAQIDAAHLAADHALQAWADANDHALEVGVSDRSPVERAALRRLPKLIVRLADPATTRGEWDAIKSAIENELTQLVTVPAKWEDIAKLPEIESPHQRLALEQTPRHRPASL